MSETGEQRIPAAVLELGQSLAEHVLAPMKGRFVAKEEVIDLLGVCLLAGENLFVLGPPGTAKSALVRDLASRLEGRVFDYLLTPFSEPNELFGPFDIRRLRDGELVTNTEGMLPEATFVFLDELLNANSAILNSLLTVLNERVFRRGRETRPLPTLMIVGASNHLPEDDALRALFDRFLLRVRCDNVPPEQLLEVAEAGWRLSQPQSEEQHALLLEDIRRLQTAVADVELADVRGEYVELVHRLRHAGIPVSDRRVVKLQRLVAASALMCGRDRALLSDLWVMRYIWDTDDQVEILRSLVQKAIDQQQSPPSQQMHPRARDVDAPDPESLDRDLDRLWAIMEDDTSHTTEKDYVRDRLGLLAARIQWIADDQQRAYLEKKARRIWTQLEKEVT